MILQKALLFVAIIGFSNWVEAQSLVCPAVRTSSGWLDLFPLPCKKNADCRVMTAQHLCCKNVCTKGVKSSAAAKRTNDKSTTPSLVTTSTSTSTTTSTTSTTTTSTTTTTTPSTTTSSTTPRTTTETSRPYLQLLPIQTTASPKRNAQTSSQATQTPAKTGKTQKLVCPKSVPVVLFPIPCENNAQCRASSGPGEVCCERRCVKGVAAPRPTSLPEKKHDPLLGVIPRECPKTPLGELLFEVQTCKTDADCWPRVCCPDGNRSYCRTARARLDLVPVASRIEAPVRMFEKYLQCTPPPQYDLFPQRCSSSVDCFPNLCCAEGGKKHCRPPQRSLLSLLAGVTQRFGPTLANLGQTPAQANKV